MFFKAKSALIIFISILYSAAAWGQNYSIGGQVTDSDGRPISNVIIHCPDADVETSSDQHGYFRVESAEPVPSLEFMASGYEIYQLDLDEETDDLQIVLYQISTNLDEVVITKSKRPKYSNKNNPAVELIRNVILHKEDNKMDSYEYLQYREYEKIQFALSNTKENLREGRFIRKYDYLKENIDTTKLQDHAILTLYMEENLSDIYHRKNPQTQRKEKIGQKKTGLDKSFFDSDGVGNYLRHLYQPIDIYENNISVVTNQFLSPIADAAPTFYRFYISDTVDINGERAVELYFLPRNMQDFLFTGYLWISLDGQYSVLKSELKVNKQTNINWVKNLSIRQEFEKNESGRFHLAKSIMSAEFGLRKTSGSGLYGERTVLNSGFLINKPLEADLFDDKDYFNKNREEAVEADPAAQLWPETDHDDRIYKNIERLQNSKSFKNAMNAATLLVAGYTKLGDYVEVGPANTFYGFNPVEGMRLRAGGRTTQALSPHLYFEGYAAYGFKDKRWKYFIGGTYSFTGKNRFEFPARNITVSYQQDTKIPGQELQFIQEDNFLLSFKRGLNDKWLYNKTLSIVYFEEFENHLSYSIGYKRWQQTAAGGLEYIRQEDGSVTPHITTSEFSAEIRWAPHERFYQGKTYRTPFPGKYPVITLRGIVGVKGFGGGEYDYQKLNLNIYKRFYLSQLGYTDAVLDAGLYIWFRNSLSLIGNPSCQSDVCLSASVL